jgi:hypothetical protein
MPRFIEEKLKKEYGDNPHAIYGTMNKLGLMKGNKETKKGKREEKEHEAKTRAIEHEKAKTQERGIIRKAIHKDNQLHKKFVKEGWEEANWSDKFPDRK